MNPQVRALFNCPNTVRTGRRPGVRWDLSVRVRLYKDGQVPHPTVVEHSTTSVNAENFTSNSNACFTGDGVLP